VQVFPAIVDYEGGLFYVWVYTWSCPIFTQPNWLTNCSKPLEYEICYQSVRLP